MLKDQLQHVVILDDHLIFAEAFSILLEKLNVFQSVHIFTRPEPVFDFIIKNESKNLLIFLDFYLEDGNCLHLINEFKRINKNIQIVIISSLMNPAIINNLLTHNINGIISKTSGSSVINDCLVAIQKGEKYLCPNIKALKQTSDQISFTDRESEILQYFAAGNSISQTAELTFLSKHTIVAHRRKMMAKANCNSITELLAFARKMGMI